MAKGLLLRKKKQRQAQQKPLAGGEDENVLWPTVIVVALVVTAVVGLFVFIGSLPAIHQNQKDQALQKGTLRR